MKKLSFAVALLGLILTSVPVAAAEKKVQPTASFEVGNTHVDRYGSGEPALVLIPGLTDSADVWNGTIEQFAPTHTIYALTLAGFGGRKPATGLLIDSAIADIAALIAQQHINKPVVVGHSLGGFITVRTAEEHSDLIRGAVAVDGLPVFPGMDAMTPDQRKAAAAQMASMLGSLTADQLYAGAKIYSVPSLTLPQNVDEVTTFSKGADPHATAEYITEMMNADVRPALSKVTVPLLELAPFDATLDPKNPQLAAGTLAEKQAYYQKLLSNAPTAKVQMIDHSRHFIMIDQPQAFYDALTNFLDTLKH